MFNGRFTTLLCALAAGAALLIGVGLSLPLELAVVVAVCVAVLGGFYIYAINLAYSKRRVASWQRDVPFDRQYCWIPEKELDRLRYVLLRNNRVVTSSRPVSETKIELATRHHVLYIFKDVGVYALLFLGVAVLDVVLIVQHHRHSASLPWLGVASFTVAFGLFAYGYIHWRYAYLLVTDLRVVRITLPPLWLAPFLDAPAKPFFHSRISNVFNRDKAASLGNFLRFGTVVIDTNSNISRGDAEDFEYIPLMRRHTQVVSVISELTTRFGNVAS